MRWLLVVVLAASCGRIGFGAAGGGDGGIDSGDSSTSDASAVTGCGSTVIIDDRFDTPSYDPWTPVLAGPISIARTGGVARFDVPIGAAADSRAGLQSLSMDFTGICAIAELSMPTNGLAVRTYLRFGLPAKNIEIYVEAGLLWGRFSAGGTTGAIGPTSYDAAAMRFLRLRSIGSQLYALEYAPSLTASSWSMLGSEGGVIADPNPSVIEVGAFVVSTASAASTAEFERVLVLGP